MEAIIIDNIPFNPDPEQLTNPFKIKPGSQRAVELNKLLAQAISIARPKVMYKVVHAEAESEGVVRFDGHPFESRVLWLNFRDTHRAFPYTITCGTELHQWKKSFEDFFTSYLADFIAAIALENATEFFYSKLKQQYGLGKFSSMNPGSLEDWPLHAQTPLFSLLGDPEKAIGVHLTDSMLMIPRHSVSGILFETETDFVNCQLCPRETCSNRRAPYDESIHAQYLPT